MTALIVEVDGRTLHFDDSRPLRIGRSIEADVLLTAGSVSRAHAELRPGPEGWTLVDVGSQYGTYVDGTRIREQRLEGRVNVQCGPDSRGATFAAVPEGHAQAPERASAFAPAPPPPPAAAGPSTPPPTGPPPGAGPGTPPPQQPVQQPFTGGVSDQTQVFAAVQGGPGAPRSGPDLLVVADGREFRFRHPAELRVGRSPDSEILVEDPACSRLHGVVAAVPGGWVYTNRSAEGTFDDGRRIESKQFDETLDLRLGHPVAGPALSLVPVLSAAEEERRFARRRRNRVLLVAAAAVAVIAVVVGTVTASALLGRDEGGDVAGGDPSGSSMEELTDAELDEAKTATVLLVGDTTDSVGRRVQYSGSGSIITSDGRILTNAHVAQPSAPGLAEYYSNDETINDPDYLLVALVNGDDDTPAEAAYRARPIEVDGERDVAVVEVYADADGNDVDPADLDLPTMELGDSDDMQSGDDIAVLGFPGISESAHITVTTGVISTFIDREDLGPRSEIDTDARIAPGNSGGAAINNDAQLIGIPSALFSDGGGSVSGRIRPINFVMDLIEEAEAD